MYLWRQLISKWLKTYLYRILKIKCPCLCDIFHSHHTNIWHRHQTMSFYNSQHKQQTWPWQTRKGNGVLFPILPHWQNLSTGRLRNSAPLPFHICFGHFCCLYRSVVTKCCLIPLACVGLLVINILCTLFTSPCITALPRKILSAMTIVPHHQHHRWSLCWLTIHR